MIYRSPLPDVDLPVISLPAFVLEHADAYGDRPALVDGPTGRTLTYTQLAAGIRRTAAGLAARGLGKGEVVAIYSPNLPEYALAFFGTALIGGVVTTVNPMYTAEELTHQLQDAGARFLVTIPQFMEQARQAAAGSAVEEVFVFGEAEGATPFAELLAHGDTPPEVAIDPVDDLVALPYSSGTTGLPKGVMLTHHNIVANICQGLAVEQVEGDAVLIAILPFYHIYGMTIIMSMALRQGAKVVTMPRFDLEQFLQLLQDHGVTQGYLVPPIILALAKHPVVDQYDLSRMEVVTSGAAPLPEAVAEACAARLGCVVKQGYGLTETSPITHIYPRDAPMKVTSVGPPIPNTEVRVIGVASGEDVAPAEVGELWIRGPQVMKGYLNNAAATAHMVDSEGWLHTGDIGYADGEGNFFVVDRVKELIKYKGFQVAPAELEALLQSHPAVADVAVIPSPDEEAGEVPKAFVVLKPNMEVSAEELMQYVADRVAPYKKVRRVAFVDAIPKVPSGKILRRKLVEQERAALAAS